MPGPFHDVSRASTARSRAASAAFTLIELLVVIAIIGVLAALLIPAGAAMKRNAAKKRAFSELKKVEAAIESYKDKMGHYPPDNTNNVAVNQLYFELLGVKQVGTEYQTLSGNGSISVAGVSQFYGLAVLGFVNSGAASDESSSAAKTYLTELGPAQFLVATNPATGVLGPVLGTQVEGPLMLGSSDGRKINPFRYLSSHPTNRIDSFDLWVDIELSGKIFRICNWSDNPIPNP